MHRLLLPLGLLAVLLAACAPAPDGGSASSVPAAWQPPAGDVRTLLTWDELAKLNSEIALTVDPGAAVQQLGFTEEAASGTVLFVGEEQGFSVEVPYTSAWNTDRFVVPPFDESAEHGVVRFGPLQQGEGGGFGRMYTIEILPRRTAQAVIADVQQQHRDMQLELPGELRPRALSVGGRSVVRSVLEGLCTFPMMEVIGKNHNYRFTTCTLDRDVSDEFAFFERVLATFKELE